MSTARIALKMMAAGLGFGGEVCIRCEQPFKRGEMMTALEDDDTGEPLGWWCASCVENIGGKEGTEHSAQSADEGV